MTSTPTDGVAALKRASALCDLDRWDDAVGLLRTVLATDPHNEEGLCLLAQARYGQAAYDESLQLSLTAISENPENEWPHRLASLALLRLGRHREAQTMGREAIRLAPNQEAGHVNLAHILTASESDLGEARAAAERAVFLAPNEAACHIAVGRVAAAAARTEEATAAFERALALDPDSHVAHNELARLHLTRSFGSKADGLAQAAGGFATALRANPREGASRFNLDLVLHLFLDRTAMGIFVVSMVALKVSRDVDVVLARVLAALLIAFPAVFVARFVSGLAPQLRGYLRQVLRTPFIAGAVLCDAIAAAGLVVGVVSQKASLIAFGCALAFSALAKLILWQQGRSRFGVGSKVPRYVWWFATGVLMVLTILVLTAVTDSTIRDTSWVLSLVAIGIAWGAIGYAIYRRWKRGPRSSV